MITINKKYLKFVGLDYYSRPVYKYGKYYYKDITLKSTEINIPNELYCSYDDIEGEPAYKVTISE